MKKIKLCIALLAAATACGAISGCGEKKGESPDDVSLLWYIPIDSQEDSNEIFAKANEMIKEKIDAVVDFVPVSFGDYVSKIQVINAAKQKYDLVFTSNWLNNYEQAVRNGTLYDITDMIHEYAPQTYNNIPEKFWEGTKVDGKIYGVINQQIMGRGPCIMVPTKNLEMDVDYNEIKTWQDCSKFLEEYHDKTGMYTYMSNLWSGLTLWHNIDELIGSDVIGAYRTTDDASDGKIEVFNQFESPEFLEYIKGRREWVEKGWTEPTIGETFDYDAFKLEYGEDKLIPQLCVYATYKPGVEKELGIAKKFDVETFYKHTPFVSRSSVTATMTGVGAYSDHPDKALQFIELLNNDVDLFNLLCFGIEGKNYTKNSDGTISLDSEHPYITQEWALGNVYNCYIKEGQSPDIWKATSEINNNSNVSSLIGFVPDTSSISTEISNCTSATTEFLTAICTGVVDVDEYYEKFMNKLKSGGCDRIVEELQRQVDEYVSNIK